MILSKKNLKFFTIFIHYIEKCKGTFDKRGQMIKDHFILYISWKKLQFPLIYYD